MHHQSENNNYRADESYKAVLKRDRGFARNLAQQIQPNLK